MKSTNMPGSDFELLATSRATALILHRYGALTDLPAELAQVVWVTAYRACAIGLKVENGGGAHAITKSMLIGGGHDARELEHRTRQMEFLNQLVPAVREARLEDRNADAQLAVDILKWCILDAPEMSNIRLFIARKFAKADPMYSQGLPQELMRQPRDA